jgi:hypothetical protein
MTKCTRVDLAKGACHRPAIVWLESRVRRQHADQVIAFGWCRAHAPTGRRVMRDLYGSFWEVDLGDRAASPSA